MRCVPLPVILKTKQNRDDMEMNESNEERSLPIRQLEEATSYSKYYDDKRFWRKVRRIAQKVGGSVLKPVLLLFYMMKSDAVSLKDKAYIVGALGYFVLPIDIVPDFIAGLGYTDDLAVITLLIKYLKDNITPDIEMRADAKIRDLIEEKKKEQ